VFIWIITPAHLRPLLIGILLTASLLLAIRVIGAEPRYQSHSLSWWLHEVVQTSSPSDTYDTYATKREASRKAMQAMGTNAIPCLLAWLQAPKRSPLKAASVWLISRQRVYPVANRWGEDSNVRRYACANRGFVLLGKEALYAIPGLVDLTKNSDESTRRRAYAQLSRLMERFHPDQDALVSAVTPSLTNANQRVSVDAAAFLCEQFPEIAERLGIHREQSDTAQRLGIPGAHYAYTLYYLSPGWHANGFTNSNAASVGLAADGAKNLRR